MPDNIVLIGKKPTMTYATSVVMVAQQHDEIIIKARGKSIQRAVDVSQLAVNRFLKGWEVGEVVLGTQQVEFEDRETKQLRKLNLSTIEISVKRRK